jgi:hypothetical protein
MDEPVSQANSETKLMYITLLYIYIKRYVLNCIEMCLANKSRLFKAFLLGFTVCFAEI